MKKYEALELSKKETEIIEKRVTVYQYEDSFAAKLLNNLPISVVISVAIGYMLFYLSS